MRRYLNKIRWSIFGQILCDAVSTVALAFMPYLIKVLFNRINDMTVNDLILLIAAYVGLLFISLVFSYCHSIFTWKGAIKFEKSLKRDYFKALCHYRFVRFNQKDVGEYIAIQSNELTELDMDYLCPLVDVFKSILALIIYGVVMFVFVDWRIGIIILSASILSTVLAPNIGSKKLSQKRKNYLDQKSTYFSRIKDLLEGKKLIKRKTLDAFMSQHEQTLSETSGKRYQYGKLKSLILVICGFFMYFINIVAFAIVGFLLFFKQITVGDGAAAFGYIESFVSPIQSLIYDFSAIKSTKAIKEKVMSFLTYADTSPLEIVDTLQERIVFSDINVAYKHFKMAHFSFTFKKNHKYAIIGGNGSGKSTIIRALMKYIEVDSGQIQIDGMDHTLLDTSALLHCVDQHEHILQASFLENITLFSSYTPSKLKEVQPLIGQRRIEKILHEKNCQNLSGGEKQLIGIARALSSEAPVLLFDESSSAMDVEMRRKIHGLITHLSHQTIISVTHDIDDHLNDYDEVLVMREGRLCLSGKWETIQDTEVVQALCRSVSEAI
ncbi:MAG TPA: ABC transporter ATP-binding protein [Thermotogota bacterium]|nr:ABC transporter ATP-binding protein [Thermotogota bacterium]